MENLNQKSWLSENAKSILIVVWFIVLWIILRILGLIFKWWPLYFLIKWLDGDDYYKTQKNNISDNASFEKKEKCMQYYDKYWSYLKETYDYKSDKWNSSIEDYEMFYNSDLDTCISAYSIFWILITDGKSFPFSHYYIVDYLNWEKELYHCSQNTYKDYVEWLWVDVTRWWLVCLYEFDRLKEKYKE